MIVGILLHHHVTVDTVKGGTTINVEVSTIDSVQQTIVEEDTVSLVHATRAKRSMEITPGDFLISTAQVQSLFIAILLVLSSVFDTVLPSWANVLWWCGVMSALFVVESANEHGKKNYARLKEETIST